MTIKIPSEQAKFMENWFTILNSPQGAERETWYFTPLYFKKVGENLFEIVQFDQLPQHVVDFIKSEQE